MSADLSLPFSDEYLKTHIAFRALRYRKDLPIQRGADVYAIQTGFQTYGLDIEQDGVFGPLTKGVAIRYQTHVGLVQDGIVGGATQRDLSLRLGEAQRLEQNLPVGLPHGHIEHESSCIPGIYTLPYPNGSRDEGVVQCNTEHFLTATAFHMGLSIRALCNRIVEYHAKYRKWGLDDDDRAWRLACGAWNAPSWCDTLARGGTLSPAAHDHITAYINAVILYADLGVAT